MLQRNAVSTPFEQNVFWCEKCVDARKNGSCWVGDKENMVDGANSHMPSQGAVAVPSWQQMAIHCHEAKFNLVN